MKPILEIQNISKKFRINHEQHPYLSLRDTITGFISYPFSKSKSGFEDFWALKDVSFDVHPGESIGIIGKNGAGKSTLLKILSKITPPTNGKIVSRGRIASLLEVGTGFHPELTGRENISLNGSILGMKKKEIQNRFDEIVDFSGVEKFLDTPLKHYSSGMQLRLAFAVAAFLEPEILVIDEVLAVGDAEFQKKCLGKMSEVAKSGRTILFVSHNMQAIHQLCHKTLLIDSGELKSFDETKIVLNQYLDTELQNAYTNVSLRESSPTFKKIYLTNDFESRVESIENGKGFNIHAEIINPQKVKINFALAFYDAFYRKIWNFVRPIGSEEFTNADNLTELIINFKPPKLTSDRIHIHAALLNQESKEEYDHLTPALTMQIFDNSSIGASSYQQKDTECIFICDSTFQIKNDL